jgi:hypothetical protein
MESHITTGDKEKMRKTYLLVSKFWNNGWHNSITEYTSIEQLIEEAYLWDDTQRIFEADEITEKIMSKILEIKKK